MMGTYTRRSILVGLTAVAAGCTGRSDDGTPTSTSTHTPTGTPTDTATKIEPSTETEEPPETEEPVQVRNWPDEYYQGPLVSAHEHGHGKGGTVFNKDEDTESFIDWMDRNKVDQAVIFASDRYVEQLADYDDRFQPFAFGWSELRKDLDDLVGAFKERFEDHPYVGIGELGFKDEVTPEEGNPIQPDHPEALELWDWAAKKDVPVMVHASEPWRYAKERANDWDEYSDCPTKKHMANAMAYNRDTEFLVHATYEWYEKPNGQIIADVLDNHPNLTYDISAIGGEILVQGPFESKEQLQTALDELGGIEGYVDQFYQEYEEILENYSDRLTWGMDTACGATRNNYTLNAIIDMSRALLGRLPEKNARNIGYRTAEELLDIDVEEERY